MDPVASTPVLHYIFDPFCGWCYAVAPLVHAARDLPGLRVALHGGGMMTGTNRRPITPAWRDYVIPHDQRIAQLTGQPFGVAYFDGLLKDATAVMDSAPPTTAVLAADALAGRGLDMLARLQQAHYQEGRRIAERAVIDALAQALGLPQDTFAATYDALAGAHTDAHMAQSRQWLRRLGGQGFPTLALDIDGRLLPIDVSAWLGRTQAWATHLQSQLAAVPRPRPAASTTPETASTASAHCSLLAKPGAC